MGNGLQAIARFLLLVFLFLQLPTLTAGEVS